jgi:exodeoxyribonuclease-5
LYGISIKNSVVDFMELNKQQKQAVKMVFDWLKSMKNPYITIGGYAGTGKTTITSYIRQLIHKVRPKAKIAFCAFTGKAATVLDATLKYHKAFYSQDSVSTIHSLIYAPIVGKKGEITGWKKKEELKYNMIIVDEASMVSRELWEDLLSFKLPILAIGDHGQLSPIGSSFSLMKTPDFKLTEIHRQAKGNPIIEVSILAREEGKIPIKDFGMGVKKLDRYDATSGQDVEEMIYGYSDDLMILTGYNHTRIKLNTTVRNFRDLESGEPVNGDKVICLKNNWNKGIYNGMMGTVSKAKKMNGSLIGSSVYEAEIVLDDGSVYSGMISADQFNSNNKPFDNKDYDKSLDYFDFGYALTVHKAQGSQANKVLLFEERNKHMDDEEWSRWLYTGVTRAEEYLTVVGVN